MHDGDDDFDVEAELERELAALGEITVRVYAPLYFSDPCHELSRV